MRRRLCFSFYSSATWQDWQLGPGFYLGTHLELSLYVGPFSFNLIVELDSTRSIGLGVDVPVREFHGSAELADAVRYMSYGRFGGKRPFDPFTKKPLVRSKR